VVFGFPTQAAQLRLDPVSLMCVRVCDTDWDDHQRTEGGKVDTCGGALGWGEFPPEDTFRMYN
jgi:hypothetical protein